MAFQPGLKTDGKRKNQIACLVKGIAFIFLNEFSFCNFGTVILMHICIIKLTGFFFFQYFFINVQNGESKYDGAVVHMIKVNLRSPLARTRCWTDQQLISLIRDNFSGSKLPPNQLVCQTDLTFISGIVRLYSVITSYLSEKEWEEFYFLFGNISLQCDP